MISRRTTARGERTGIHSCLDGGSDPIRSLQAVSCRKSFCRMLWNSVESVQQSVKFFLPRPSSAWAGRATLPEPQTGGWL